MDKKIQILRQIVKSSQSIRRKHLALKVGKEAAEQANNRKFKPIVEPLEKIVKKLDEEYENYKNASIPFNAKKEEREVDANELKKQYDESPMKRAATSTNGEYDQIEGDEHFSSNDADDMFVTPVNKKIRLQFDSPDYEVNQTEAGINNSTPTTSSTPKETSTLQNTSLSSTLNKSWNVESPLKKYLKIVNNKKTSSNQDTIYGVRKLRNGLHIGDTAVKFQHNSVILDDSKYPATEGLMELLVKKYPDSELITEEDMVNFGKIIDQTNSARKHYKANENFRNDTSVKFKNFVSKAINIKGGSLSDSRLPEYSDADIDYVYWDDPNELVDRLRLLLAERQAGNPSHDNEIMSIIEELREAQIIY